MDLIGGEDGYRAEGGRSACVVCVCGWCCSVSFLCTHLDLPLEVRDAGLIDLYQCRRGRRRLSLPPTLAAVAPVVPALLLRHRVRAWALGSGDEAVCGAVCVGSRARGDAELEREGIFNQGIDRSIDRYDVSIDTMWVDGGGHRSIQNTSYAHEGIAKF